MRVGMFRNQHVGNFAALVVSAVAATLAPLQVFLFVYAFVGPLHYLTEMAWLKKKDFYSAGGLVSSPVYVFTASLLCVAVTADFYLHRGISAYSIALLVLLSIATRVRSAYILLGVVAVGVFARFIFHGFAIFVAGVLPSIVHVYFFTLLFMLSGLVREMRDPLKRRSVLAWANPVLLLALPPMLLTLHRQYASPGPYWLTAETGFTALHRYFVRLLGSDLHPDASILANPAAAGVLRVLAFIYLFHYLNWFAKTELLNWHRVSRRSWTVVLSMYGLSVGLYLWNFTVGLYLVNFLSLLHVFLEFPLNWHTGHFLTASIARIGRGSGRGSTGDDVRVAAVR